MSLPNSIENVNLYVTGASLQQFFIDKDTGEPLSNGTITSYRDIDRTPTGYKPLYVIGGAPNAPTFTALPNPLTLSSIGSIIDPNNGDQIVPYYLPYDQFGNPDQYYLVITSSASVVQETIEHFPPIEPGVTPPTIDIVNNLMPDGQFTLYQNLGGSGLVAKPSLLIAWGSWSFVLDNSFTSTNFVTFERFNSPVNSPANNPRYAVRVVCTVPNGAEIKKDILYSFQDVNLLQGQAVTFQFSANSNDSANHSVELIIQQNFGTSESIIETIVTNFTIVPGYNNYFFNFTVPSTIGQTLASDDSDSFSIGIRFPTSTTFDISSTGYIYTPGTFTGLTFQPDPPEVTKAYSLPASFQIPANDGSDLNKFPIITEYFTDHGVVTYGFQYASEVDLDYAVDVGATNAVAVHPAYILTEYFNGKPMHIKVSHSNTGASTLSVSSLAGIPIRVLSLMGLLPLNGYEMIAGQIYEFIYDGTFWQLLNPSIPPAVFAQVGFQATSTQRVTVNPSLVSYDHVFQDVYGLWQAGSFSFQPIFPGLYELSIALTTYGGSSGVSLTLGKNSVIQNYLNDALTSSTQTLSGTMSLRANGTTDTFQTIVVGTPNFFVGNDSTGLNGLTNANFQITLIGR